MRWGLDVARSENGRSVGIASCGFQTQLSIVLSFLGCPCCCPCIDTSALLQEMCLVHVRQGEALDVQEDKRYHESPAMFEVFSLIEKSQRHYSSTLGGAGPCCIFHGLIQSSSAMPQHSVVIPAMGPSGTNLLPAPSLCVPCCPCSSS